MSRPMTALVAFFALAGSAAAQLPPVYHGLLTIRPAQGRIDPVSGQSSITVKRWDFLASPDSNGMNPATEPVQIAMGELDRFTIPVGAIKVAKNGRVFTFRDKSIKRGIRSLRLQQTKSGIWRVRFQAVGIELSRLTLEYPFCHPLALIVGDDDGFSGIELDRPGGFSGKRVRVVGFCTDLSEWPWL
ncbi:MAG: hypothetical protein KIT14_16325 [bacterium]|nr:hypothetical protein [bacterium]